MAKRTVRRATSEGAAVEPITARFTQFLTLKSTAAAMTTRADILKKDLGAHADANGTVEEEDKGHKVVRLPQPIQVGDTRYVGFMRQKRTPDPTFNEERAEELCESKGFDREDYISTQEYVDQEKVYRLYAEDRLTDEEMKSLLDQADPTWAFVPMKES